MKDLVHLVTSYREPTLCGNLFGASWLVSTYIVHPNLNEYTIQDYKWCPDCLKHPEVVMARLNGTNV